MQADPASARAARCRSPRCPPDPWLSPPPWWTPTGTPSELRAAAGKGLQHGGAAEVGLGKAPVS